ncbi:MAG: hypothetical protein OEW84_01380 [Aigarchaeota archaeon]|nr:hypothetical protein [Aigarchaeota archaeon]
MAEDDALHVNIIYKGVETSFKGHPEQVYRAVISYLEKAIPAFSLASKVSFSLDLQKILSDVKDVLAYVPAQGMMFINTISSFPMSDAVMLYLLKCYLEHSLGMRESPSAAIADIKNALTHPEKSISSRLTELMKRGWVRRVGRGSYVATLIGVREISERMRPETK